MVVLMYNSSLFRVHGAGSPFRCACALWRQDGHHHLTLPSHMHIDHNSVRKPLRWIGFAYGNSTCVIVINHHCSIPKSTIAWSLKHAKQHQHPARFGSSPHKQNTTYIMKYLRMVDVCWCHRNGIIRNTSAHRPKHLAGLVTVAAISPLPSVLIWRYICRYIQQQHEITSKGAVNQYHANTLPLSLPVGS